MSKALDSGYFVSLLATHIFETQCPSDQINKGPIITIDPLPSSNFTYRISCDFLKGMLCANTLKQMTPVMLANMSKKLNVLDAM